MEHGYIDLHTHTNLSDGKCTPEELILAARNVGIRVLAITDHNVCQKDLPRLRKRFPDMVLPEGCEISCREPGVDDEIHIVALDFDPAHPAMIRILQKNKIDRRPRIEAILRRLREECGIELGSYEQLKEENPGCEFVGRAHIAQKRVRLGYVPDTETAYGKYIGAEGCVFVKKDLPYISMKEAVEGILEAGGIPILAHPLYYRISRERLEQLVEKFARLGGLAMEVAYAFYDEEQMAYLASLAARYGLLHSAGSDFHGIKPGDFLGRPFPMEIYLALMEVRR